MCIGVCLWWNAKIWTLWINVQKYGVHGFGLINYVKIEGRSFLGDLWAWWGSWIISFSHEIPKIRVNLAEFVSFVLIYQKSGLIGAGCIWGSWGRAACWKRCAFKAEKKRFSRAAESAQFRCSRHSELSGEPRRKEGRERTTPFSLVIIFYMFRFFFLLHRTSRLIQDKRPHAWQMRIKRHVKLRCAKRA